MNTLWFGNEFMNPIEIGELDGTLRYGDRTIPGIKTPYNIGDIVLVRFKKSPYGQVPPIFEEYEPRVQINRLDVMKFDQLTESHLIRTDIQDLNLKKAKEKLEFLYNHEIRNEDLVTLIRFLKV
jgi:hypothetical protein